MTKSKCRGKVDSTLNEEEKSRVLNTAKRVRRVEADMDRDVKCISEFGGLKENVGLPGSSRYRARVCGMTKYLMSCLWQRRWKY